MGFVVQTKNSIVEQIRPDAGIVRESDESTYSPLLFNAFADNSYFFASQKMFKKMPKK